MHELVLVLRAIGENPLVPLCVENVPGERQVIEKFRRRAQAPARADAVEHGAAATRFDALGRNRSRRVDAIPATSSQPDFGPRMGIRLADDHVGAHRVDFAALVAEHDT